MNFLFIVPALQERIGIYNLLLVNERGLSYGNGAYQTTFMIRNKNGDVKGFQKNFENHCGIFSLFVAFQFHGPIL